LIGIGAKKESAPPIFGAAIPLARLQFGLYHFSLLAH
jgi:hypothetical protein